MPELERAGAPPARARWTARIPAPLALLLATVALFATLWALLVPAWAGPDEDVHFAYVQTLAERHELPGKGTQAVSTAQRQSMNYTNTDPVVFFNYAKPEWSRPVASEWEQAARFAKSDDGGGGNAAAAYPPAYYLLETIPYATASSGSVLTRLYTMRLFSGIWLLVSTVAAWLLAGEVFGRRRPLQLVTAAAVGLWPMITFISTVVSPDGMLIALWTLCIWLGASVVTRGLSFGRAAPLCACVGLAIVTKGTGLALVPPTAVALGIGAWRLWGHRVSARTVLRAGIAITLLLIPVVGWYVAAHATGHPAYAQAEGVTSTGGGGAAGGTAEVTHASLGSLASYLWQFYLPRLPVQSNFEFLFPAISHYPVFQTFLGGSWANFGWANVWFPTWVYYVFAAVTAATVAAAASTGLRRLRARSGEKRRRLAGSSRAKGLAIFFTVTVATLLAGLHWTEYQMYLNRNAPFLQGRYILPLGALAALVLAQATQAVPVRLRRVATGAVLTGLVVLQILCLGLVVARYYA